jgi:predicted amidophosphoribosyltransferase
MKPLCPKCLKALEVIKACGCRDYFCNHCNELVSKSKIIEPAAAIQKEKEMLKNRTLNSS